MVNILLATFNGEKYVKQQLDSLLLQSYSDFKVYIRDDNSTDKTRQILDEYAKKHPEKILFIPSVKSSGSAKENFFSLLYDYEYQGDYFMCCDQDDCWLPDKIESTFKVMKQVEEQYGKETPLLIHTDLKVVNEDLQEIAPSFTAYQKLRPDKNTFNYLLVQNNVTGCTMLFNRSLLDKSRLDSAGDRGDVLMHDWWLGLTAAAFGAVVFMRKSTILYRQHSGNQVGAKDARRFTYLFGELKKAMSHREKGLSTHKQAKVFEKRFSGCLEPLAEEVLNAFLYGRNKGRFSCFFYTIKYKLFNQGFLRNFGRMGLDLFFYKKKG